jgi:hypothetical protein
MGPGGRAAPLMVLLVTMLALAGCAQTKPVDRFQSEEAGVSLALPVGWPGMTAWHGGRFHQVVLVHSPDQKASISLVVVEESGLSAEEYRTAMMDRLQRHARNFVPVKAGERELQGQTCYWYIYQYDDAGVPVRAAHCIVVRKAKTFILNYAALSAEFDRYWPEFEQAMVTLRWER